MGQPLGPVSTTTITYIDNKITEQHEYTDQEVEALRTEGYIQEALTQLAGAAAALFGGSSTAVVGVEGLGRSV